MHVSRHLRRAAALAGALALSGGTAVASGPIQDPVRPTASITGTVSQTGGDRLPGMRVEAQPVGTTGCTAATGCAWTYTGHRGVYALGGLQAGSYALEVLDGARLVTVTHVTLTTGQTARATALELGPPAVPAGTFARNAGRDLAALNAQRRRDGVPADVVLNPRWSQECAAHDDYEAANGVLQSAEDPTANDASPGGAWAGLNSDLAEGRWTRAATPWANAPIHLLALLAPSLSVTGIDDSPTLQCAVTFPGMLGRWTSPDAITTVPGPGETGIATSELARETPFTPVQFVGLRATRRTGRELFVYLNRDGELGQAPVRILHATLQAGGRTVPVRWVDSATRTIGSYLAGGIIIPPAPLRPATRYRARVVVRDGARTLTRAWSFVTAQSS